MKTKRANWFVRTSVFALACVLFGCVSVGREFPVRPIPKIQIGETTQNEVARVFGRPWRTGLEDGRKTWTYGQYRYTIFGYTLTRDLVIRFDDNNVIESYTFNSTEPDDLRR